MSVSKEERVKFYLEGFRNYVVEQVDAFLICSYYDLIDKGTLREIAALAKTSPVEASKKFFKFVDDLDEPGKYTELLKALKEAEYEKIHMILSGKEIPDDENQQKVLQLLGSRIGNILDPIEILPGLQNKNVLIGVDSQKIQRESTNNGTIMAALLLVELLPRRLPNWFNLFLQELVEQGKYDELAVVLEPDLTAKMLLMRDEGGKSLTVFVEKLSESNKKIDIEADVDTAANTAKMYQKTLAVSEEEVKPGLDTNLPSSVRENILEVSETQMSEEKTQLMMSPNQLSFRQKADDLDEETSLKKVDTTDGSTSLKRIDDLHKTSPVTEVIYEASLGTDVQDSSVGPASADLQALASLQRYFDEIVLQPPTAPLGLNVQRDESACKKLNRVHESDDSSSDTYDSDSDNNAEVFDEEVELYDYQSYLAAPAVAGKNVIVVSPPNSGKTIIAMKVMQEHLKHARVGQRKVIFLVNQVNLAKQQVKTCRKYLGKYKPKLLHGQKDERLKTFLPLRNVFVVTAQVFLNALREKEIESVAQFSMMVFDECHHTKDSHAFNLIMELYHDLKCDPKTDPKNLPQILGLTASPGTDKGNTIPAAELHIRTLMANLDTPVLRSGSEEHATPETEVITAARRDGGHDKFGITVRKLMETIEKWIKKEVESSDKLPSPSSCQGKEQYIQYLSELTKFAISLKDERLCRFLTPCITHLEKYNSALMLYEDSRVEDALKYLEDEMFFLQHNPNKTENEERLIQCYNRVKESHFGDSHNPKLERMKELILKECAQDDSCCGIVFVKRRVLAQALIKWMKTVEVFKPLNPGVFVGQATTSNSGGGMTRPQQKAVLKGFRNGTHRLLVATSIAEEGLHIPDCKFIIRYEHVTNETSRIQSRGRGRRVDSHYFILTSENSDTADKEMLNLHREKIMKEAIHNLEKKYTENPVQFVKEIQDRQKSIRATRQEKDQKDLNSLQCADNFKLVCKNCNTLICMASDMRKIQAAHHVIIDPEIEERVVMIEEGSGVFREIQFIGKTFCKACMNKLGPICLYKHLKFPILKSTRVWIVDMEGKKREMKKWKSAGFRVQELSDEDILQIINIM